MNLRSGLRSEASAGRREVGMDGGATTREGAPGAVNGASAAAREARALPPLKFSQKVLAQAMVSGVWWAYQHLVLPV